MTELPRYVRIIESRAPGGTRTHKLVLPAAYSKYALFAVSSTGAPIKGGLDRHPKLADLGEAKAIYDAGSASVTSRLIPQALLLSIVTSKRFPRIIHEN